MTILTNIHLLRPMFTLQGYTGLKVKNILDRFLPTTNWKKVVANTMFFTSLVQLFNGNTQFPRSESFIFKNWRQKSANLALLPRMSLGSTPGMTADKYRMNVTAKLQFIDPTFRHSCLVPSSVVI